MADTPTTPATTFQPGPPQPATLPNYFHPEVFGYDNAFAQLQDSMGMPSRYSQGWPWANGAGRYAFGSGAPYGQPAGREAPWFVTGANGIGGLLSPNVPGMTSGRNPELYFNGGNGLLGRPGGVAGGPSTTPPVTNIDQNFLNQLAGGSAPQPAPGTPAIPGSPPVAVDPNFITAHPTPVGKDDSSRFPPVVNSPGVGMPVTSKPIANPKGDVGKINDTSGQSTPYIPQGSYAQVHGYDQVNPLGYQNAGRMDLNSMSPQDLSYIYQQSIPYSRQTGRDLFKDMFGIGGDASQMANAVNMGESAAPGNASSGVQGMVQGLNQSAPQSPFMAAYLRAHPGVNPLTGY